MKISSNIRKFNGGFLDDIDFRLSLANQRLVRLEANLTKAEKMIKATPLIGLYAKLCILVENHNISTTVCGNNRGTISVEESKFQADSYIARAFNEKKCDLIFSNDSDFFAHCDGALIVNNFKYNGKGKDILENLGLASSSRAVINSVAAALGISENDILVPAFPIFEDQTTLVKAIASIAIGCDVYPGGVHNVGPKMIYSEISKAASENRDIFQHLLDFVSQHNNCSLTVGCLKALVAVFVYEPAIGVSNSPGAFLYMNDEPVELPQYCSDFCSPNVRSAIVTGGPVMSQCVGTNQGSTHLFLNEMGCFTCERCAAVLCKYCKVPSDWDSAADLSESKKKDSQDDTHTSSRSYLCGDCFVGKAIAGGAESFLDSQTVNFEMKIGMIDMGHFVLYFGIIRMYQCRTRAMLLRIASRSVRITAETLEKEVLGCNSVVGFLGRSFGRVLPRILSIWKSRIFWMSKRFSRKTTIQVTSRLQI